MDESLPDGEQSTPPATADHQDGNYDVQELSVFWEQFLSANDECSRVSSTRRAESNSRLGNLEFDI